MWYPGSIFAVNSTTPSLGFVKLCLIVHDTASVICAVAATTVTSRVNRKVICRFIKIVSFYIW